MLIGLVWITNPLTIPAMFYLSYRVGAMIIDIPVEQVEFEFSSEWFKDSMATIWQPFLLGSVICGLFFATLVYFVISMLWRMRVASHRAERKRSRAARK